MNDTKTIVLLIALGVGFLLIVGDRFNKGFLRGSHDTLTPATYESASSQDSAYMLYRKPFGPGLDDVLVRNADGSN